MTRPDSSRRAGTREIIGRWATHDDTGAAAGNVVSVAPVGSLLSPFW
jgi:hypothetical protein